jgi:hypothetical protein
VSFTCEDDPKSAQVAHPYLLEASVVYALQHALLGHLYWVCWAWRLRRPKQQNRKHGLDALGMLNELLSAALMNSSIPPRSSQSKCTICVTHGALKHPAIQFDAQSCTSNGNTASAPEEPTLQQAAQATVDNFNSLTLIIFGPKVMQNS